MSSDCLLSAEEWNEELSFNETSFPMDPAFKELFKKDNQSLDDFVQWIKGETEIRQTVSSDSPPIFISFLQNKAVKLIFNDQSLININYVTKDYIKRKRKRIKITDQNQQSLKVEDEKILGDDIVSTDTSSKEANQELTEDHAWSINRELLQSLKSLFEQVTQFGKDSDIKEFLSKFNNLIRLPHVQLHKYFEELDMSQIDDKILEILCNDIVQHEDIVYQNYVVFIKITLLKKVRLITSKPSRDLLSILSKMAKAKSKPIVYGLLLPLIKESQEIDRPQLEVITRITNGGLSEESVLSLITELFADFRILNESVGRIRPNHLENWDDSMIEILFSVFNQKFQIENQDIFKRFLYYLNLNIEIQSKNQKLGQILLLLVTKHSESIMDHLEEIKIAAEKSNTFMKKSVLGKVNSLTKKRASHR